METGKSEKLVMCEECIGEGRVESDSSCGPCYAQCSTCKGKGKISARYIKITKKIDSVVDIEKVKVNFYFLERYYSVPYRGDELPKFCVSAKFSVKHKWISATGTVSAVFGERHPEEIRIMEARLSGIKNLPETVENKLFCAAEELWHEHGLLSI